MASNHFGQIFKITTWGESHGKAIGVVIDGCPAGLELSEQEINDALQARAPGRNAYTSPRKEADLAEIYSGIFQGKTTGAPIAIIIPNTDADSSKYEPTKNLLKPGHANSTYLQKYGCFDHRGGGRASARETACRVAAGAVANKILEQHGIKVQSYIQQIGHAQIKAEPRDFSHLENSLLFCPDPQAEQEILGLLEQAKIEGDSLGGIVRCVATGLPAGLGEPIYEKLEATLAKAMLSIPASKGFEIGSGFAAAQMSGSKHNDCFVDRQQTATNHAGGTLGGISTGMPLCFNVAFKPTSSIRKPQQTIDLDGQQQTFQLPEGSRHDPCVAIRAVPVVQAMCRLVLADHLLWRLDVL